MSSPLTIILTRAGVPVELENAADWRRAIMRGQIGRETIVTVVGRGPSRMVPAEDVPELAGILDEVEPRERQEQVPAAPVPDAPVPTVSPPPTRRKRAQPTSPFEPQSQPIETADVEQHVQWIPAPPTPKPAEPASGSSAPAWIVAGIAALILVASARSCNPTPETPVAVDPVQNAITDPMVEEPIAAAPLTFETSFNCERAAAEAERLICASAGLARVDRELAALYGRVFAEAADEDKQVLRQEQRAWLELRNACADEPFPESCLERVYAERATALRERPTVPATGDAEEGTTVDSEGNVVQSDGAEQPDAETNQAEPARSNIDLASLVSSDDYPSSALRSEEQGTTGFRLEIGVNGRVTECVVTSSSGSSALDSATCRIMKSRARFTPAVDRDGNPIPDSVQSRITWRLGE
ncbi:MAG TPA: TonB family protein [Allosphingosinicella sp.]|jgi:TonB family protein